MNETGKQGYIRTETVPNEAQWPDPTPEMLASPQFEAIWQCIKRWDINVPDVYSGYCGATGNHVRAILDTLTAVGRDCGCLHVSRHGHQDDCELTAAAEAGDELESGVLLTKAIDEVIAEDIEKERLQELVSQGIQIERQLRKELLTLRAATIERCAQEMENYFGFSDDERRIAAAAIRALKDKP